MILGDSIVNEIGKIDYDIVLSDNPWECQADIRNWSMMAFSKAVYTFVTSSWSTNFIANGSFTNNTNYLGSPPYNPIITPTISVPLKTESPKFKSHKELYDIMLPYFRTTENFEDNFIDLFQRIFIDWLGALEVGCGQDSTTALPTIAPTSLNVAPPYFHSLDGGTVDQFEFPDTDYSKYPQSQNQQEVPTDNVFEPSSTTLAQFDARIDELNLTLVKIDNELSDDAITDDEIAEREEYLVLWRDRPLEIDNQMKSNSEEIGDIEYAKMTGKPFDQNRMNYLNAENQDLADEKIDTYDTMMNTFQFGNYEFVIGSRGASEARKIVITDERDSMIEQKLDYFNGKLPTIDIPDVPPKTDVGFVHSDAPELSSTRVSIPDPLDWKYPVQSGYPTIQLPVFFTFPTSVLNSRLCAEEIASRSDEAKSDLGIVNRILGKWIVITLNQSIPTVGGDRGYCYGSPLNVWNGVVVGTINWSES